MFIGRESSSIIVLDMVYDSKRDTIELYEITQKYDLNIKTMLSTKYYLNKIRSIILFLFCILHDNMHLL